MKKTLITRLALWSAVIVAMLATQSCSGDKTLQSSIPADARLVAAVDCEKIMKALDWEIKDGKLVVQPEIAQAIPPEDAQLYATATQAVDSKNVYLVQGPSGAVYATATITDDAKLQAWLTGQGAREAKASSPFDACYTLGSGAASTVVTRDKQAWLLLEGTCDDLAADLKSADKASMDGVASVSDVLAGDGMIRLAIQSKEMAGYMPAPGMAQAAWVAGTIDADGANLCATLSSYDTEGNTIKIKGGKAIDTSFLRYFPGSFNFLMAWGCSPDTDWDTLLAPAQSAGMEATAMAETAKPYLKAIDGTIALGCVIPTDTEIEAIAKGDFQGASTIQAIMMVQMDAAKANELVGILLKYLQEAGLTTQQRTNGLYSLTVGGGLNFDFGVIDGYFAVSTVPLKNDAKNDFAPVVKGQEFAALLNVPTLRPLFDLDLPVDFTVQAGDESVKFTLKSPDSSTPVLASMLKAAAR